MDFSKVLKKAMVDKNVDSAVALGEATGISSYITRRLLKGDGTCSLNDLKVTADYLNVKIKYLIDGEK